MKVFISWSGERSHAVALALREWLPSVIQALEPWMSGADIQRGAQWPLQVASRLSECNVGIICLTPENLNENWILFEAGALSKVLDRAHVCTYLIGIEPTDLEWPLAMFQATVANKESTRAMIQTLNHTLGQATIEDSRLNNIFDVWWPRLEQRLEELPLADADVAPQRTQRAIVEEILGLVRQHSIQLHNVASSLTASGTSVSQGDAENPE